MSSSGLPPEILGEIFVLCLPDRHSDRLSPENAPTLVCRISSYWRKVAIGEPRLWDMVIFPPSNLERNARFIGGGGVDRWFGRTGRVWLLSFGDEPSRAPVGSIVIRCLHYLSRYARRFKHLSLVTTKIKHLETLCRVCPSDIFHQLKSISLCCSTEMHSYTLQTLPRFGKAFKKATKLEHVSLILPKADLDTFALPWSRLTSIEVTGLGQQLGVREWRNVFGMCRRLRRGIFVFPNWRTAWSKRALVHPSLESLTLVISLSQSEASSQYANYAPDHDLGRLLSAVAFPNIQHLRFEFEARRKRVYNIPSACHTIRASLKTIVFGWQGEANREAPIEASEFIGSLIREPGAFGALRHIVLPCKSNKLHHLVTVLRSHPRLRLTVTAVPRRVEGWVQAIERHEDSKAIRDRIQILSTDRYYLLDQGSYYHDL